MSHQTIIVLDFGSQFTQLIARRLRELSVYSEILPFNTPLDQIRAKQPIGLILSGGPRSVHESGVSLVARDVFDIGVPILGICYSMQLMTASLDSTVARSAHREFSQAIVAVDPACEPVLFAQTPRDLRI